MSDLDFRLLRTLVPSLQPHTKPPLRRSHDLLHTNLLIWMLLVFLSADACICCQCTDEERKYWIEMSRKWRERRLVCELLERSEMRVRGNWYWKGIGVGEDEQDVLGDDVGVSWDGGHC